MGSRRRRSRPARLEWERVALLRFSFLMLYGDDAEFGRELAEFETKLDSDLRWLLASHRELKDFDTVTSRDADVSVRAGAYRKDLNQLATRFGLDRFVAPDGPSDAEFTASVGERRLHLWCHACAQSRLDGYGPRPPAEFSHLDGFRGPDPNGEPFLIDAGHPPPRRFNDEAVGSVDERGDPIVHAVITSIWDPRAEAPRDAKTRLMRSAEVQIDAEIDRIVRAAEKTGFTFRATPTARRNLGWLFLKTRHGWSYADIATRWARDDTAAAVAGSLHVERPAATAGTFRYEDRELVQKAVIRMADDIGVSRTGW